MNHARVIRRPAPQVTGKAAGEQSSGRKATKWIVGVAILLLTAVAAWAYLPEGKDPNLAKIEQLREQMDGATGEQRRELWGQMREVYRSLPEEARQQLSDQRRQRWEAREQKFLNEFFAMTPAEQTAKIDEQLKEEEERSKRWAQRRAQRSQQGVGGARNGGQRGGRGRGNRDSLERRKNYLDRTSPQTRAQRSEYRRMRDARRQALGLPDRWRR
jgi:hypothetical protein